MNSNSRLLVSAQELERMGVLRKGTAYRMAKAGQIPHYVVGTRIRGIRFKIDEVLASLRRPVALEEK